MLRLFIGGPAHGTIIHIPDPEPLMWRVTERVPMSALSCRSDAVAPVNLRVHNYSLGRYRFAPSLQRSNDRFVYVAVTEGALKHLTSSDIERIARQAGMRDTMGVPI